jgi:hypothetical protein
MPARLGRIDFLEAEDVLDTLHDEQLAISEELDELGRSLATRGLTSTERQAIADVRDALAVFLLATASRPVLRAFLPESALARYLLALYAALHGVIADAAGQALHDAPLPNPLLVRRSFRSLAEEAEPAPVAELTAAFERLVDVVEAARPVLG